MTDLIFFDTDCISAFLWINNESLLLKLYPGRIVIPKPVYMELNHPNIKHLKTRIDKMISTGNVIIKEILVGSEEYETYYQLTEKPKNNHRIIGKGEASSISLALKYDGIVASNNLSDVNVYINEFSLKHVTTGDILVEAYQKCFITENEGNQIWQEMIMKRRKIGALTFSEYLKLHHII